MKQPLRNKLKAKKQIKQFTNHQQSTLKVPKTLFPFSSPYGRSPEGEGGLGI